MLVRRTWLGGVVDEADAGGAQVAGQAGGLGGWGDGRPGSLAVRWRAGAACVQDGQGGQPGQILSSRMWRFFGRVGLEEVALV